MFQRMKQLPFIIPAPIRQIATFLSFSLILFIIPLTMQNSHPALLEVSNQVPAKNGVVQFVAKPNAEGQTIIESAETLSDVSLLNPKNVFFTPLFSNAPAPPIFWSVNTVSQPMDAFAIERHTQFESLLNSSRLIVHLINPESQQLWEDMSNHPQIEPLNCISPSWLTFLQWDICQAQFDPSLIRINSVGVFGWSDPEPWGIWTIDRQPRALFVADTGSDYQLEIEWFPNCIDGTVQSAKVLVNQTEIGDFLWSNCETTTTVFNIPQETLNKKASQSVLDRNLLFENELSFEFAYATSETDPRDLAVGFNKILITKSQTNVSNR